MQDDFITEKRYIHSLAVAKECYRLSKEEFEQNETFAKKMFVAGYNHDIGYAVVPEDCYSCHNIISAELIKSTFEVENRIYYAIKYHGNPATPKEYQTLEWLILNIAELTIDSNGNRTSVKHRLNNIKEEKGQFSDNYKNAGEMKEKISLILKENYNKILL